MKSETEYYGDGHLKLYLFVQIEQKSAADDAENIANIPYLDGCVLVMHDLSGSIGKLGDVFCDENIKLAKKSIDAFKKAGKTVGVSTFATDSVTLEKYYRMGVNLISTGADYDYIAQKGKETMSGIAEIKKCIKDKKQNLNCLREV